MPAMDERAPADEQEQEQEQEQEREQEQAELMAGVPEEMRGALAAARAYIHTLPILERQIATLAADGEPVWEIAQRTRVSEAAVWRTLDGVLAAVTGREMAPVETGGLGADTDPGVTGGYGDTGFGALDTEPLPDNEEPTEG